MRVEPSSLCSKSTHRRDLLYIVLYMDTIRTQVYLTAKMRAEIDTVMHRDHTTLAQIVRQALAAYLADQHPDADAALASTFGSMPDLSAPSREEWERG